MITNDISCEIATNALEPDRIAVIVDNEISVHIIKTAEGYVVDAYRADGSLIDTMAVWTCA